MTNVTIVTNVLVVTNVTIVTTVRVVTIVTVVINIEGNDVYNYVLLLVHPHNNINILGYTILVPTIDF